MGDTLTEMAKSPTAPDPDQVLWLAFEWRLYHEWATELGFDFDEVQRLAGIKPASEGSRSSAWRAEHGGAPRVRRAIYDQLVKLEKKATMPSKLGAVALGLEEWVRIGRQLAMNGTGFVFLRQLQSARQALADATGRAVTGAVPKKQPKAIDKSKAELTLRVADDPDEEAVAVGGRKRR